MSPYVFECLANSTSCPDLNLTPPEYKSGTVAARSNGNYVDSSLTLCGYSMYHQVKQSWVTSSRCVFLNKVLIVLPNTTIHIQYISLFNTLLHVSAVQISHHQVGDGYTKKNIKREMPLSNRVLSYNCIITKMEL